MRLEINYSQKSLQKNRNTWMTNNHVTKQQKVRERIKEEIKKDMKNETVIQSLWNVAKAILRGKFTATQTYHKKKKLQINNLTLHINELEKKGEK